MNRKAFRRIFEILIAIELICLTQIDRAQAGPLFDFSLIQAGFETTIVDPFPTILGIKPFITLFDFITADFGGDLPTLILSLVSRYKSYSYGGSVRVKVPGWVDSPFIGVAGSRQVVRGGEKLYGGDGTRQFLAPIAGYEMHFNYHFHFGVGAQVIFKRDKDGQYLLLTDANPQRSISAYPYFFVGYAF